MSVPLSYLHRMFFDTLTTLKWVAVDRIAKAIGLKKLPEMEWEVIEYGKKEEDPKL